MDLSPLRWLALGLVVVLCLLFLVPAIAGLVQQRSHIAELEQQIGEQQAAITELDRERELWQDDEYVERQARERLRFVRPGELSYQVLADGDRPAIKGIARGTDPAGERGPWYGELWDSVIAASEGGLGAPVTAPEETPAAEPTGDEGGTRPSSPPTLIRDTGNPDRPEE